MTTLPCDADVASAPALRARLSHRLARHVRVGGTPVALSGAAVSFTFDDVPDSACTAGADLLGAHGALGTYYVSGGLIGRTGRHWRLAGEGDIAALHRAGHEIGCHTHAHPFLPSLRPEAVEAEAARNLRVLRGIVPDLTPASFAYPFGYAALGAKRVLARVYRSSRSIMPGLNRAGADPHFLRAYPLIEGQIDPEAIPRLMAEAAAQGAWLIFFGHDVAARPSPYGCTPGLLEAALKAAVAHGLPCRSVAGVLGAPASATGARVAATARIADA